MKIFDITTQIFSKGDKNYPKELLDLVDPPQQIHVRGNYSTSLFKNSLAVVGSRDMTPYGKHVIESFIQVLVSSGIHTISGFMYGVDTAAHRSTLRAGGTTIAVLGNGLNYLYPRENEGLYAEIIQSGGCMISEYPDDFRPQKWTFPARNRIVAALSSLGTCVIEAGEHSGSLITASYADALNRPLFAVPGPIFSENSKGTHQLLKDGLAQWVTTPEELLEKLKR